MQVEMEIPEKMREVRLRWYGHVLRSIMKRTVVKIARKFLGKFQDVLLKKIVSMVRKTEYY